ncbi:MAG: polymer-forming cytoskeletal protein [Planctomycetota bacterium]
MSALRTRRADGSQERPRTTPERFVRCYLCGATIKVAVRAQSSFCSSCQKRLVVPDQVIKNVHWGGVLASCGTITVQRRGRAITKVTIASGGVIIHGEHEGLIISGGPVQLSSGGVLRGGVIAPEFVFGPDAVIEGDPFRIPCDPLGRLDPERAALLVSKGKPLPSLAELRGETDPVEGERPRRRRRA